MLRKKSISEWCTFASRAHVFRFSASSNALCEICYHPMCERTIRVGFDLDERCTLVKYSLPRSIFWKDAIFFSAGKAKGKKKRKEGDILFPCYPRVARSLKSARLYTRRICRLWKCFSPAPTTIFPTISRRTSSIMCLLLDVYPSLLTDYLWSTFFTQLSVEMLVLSLERYWTSRLDGSHQDLLYLTLLAATMKTMYDSSESRSSTDVVAVSRAGFWIVVARWRPKDTRSRTDNGTGREKRLILYLSDLHLCAARKAQPYRSSLSSRSKEQFFSKIRIYR